MSGSAESPLARAADLHLSVAIDKEACPLNLAPTASTTATLGARRRARHGAARGARLHPRGLRPPAPGRPARQAAAARRPAHARGRPAAGGRARDADARRHLRDVAARDSGVTAVVDAEGRLAGVISDGDLRRLLEQDDSPLRAHRRRVHEAGPARRSPATSSPRRRSSRWRTTASPRSSSPPPTAACAASSTSTTSGASSCSEPAMSEALRRQPELDAGARPPGARARPGCCSTSTACSPTAGSISRRAARSFKSFHVRDGLAVKLARAAGLSVGILSARESAIVAARARRARRRRGPAGPRGQGRGLPRAARPRAASSRPRSPTSATTCRTCRCSPPSGSSAAPADAAARGARGGRLRHRGAAAARARCASWSSGCSRRAATGSGCVAGFGRGRPRPMAAS